jgi:hypothetical protein
MCFKLLKGKRLKGAVDDGAGRADVLRVLQVPGNAVTPRVMPCEGLPPNDLLLPR